MKFKKMSLSLISVLLLASCGQVNDTSEESTTISSEETTTSTKSAEEVKKEYIENVEDEFLASASEVTYTDTTVTFSDANSNEFTLERGVSDVCILYPSFTTLWYEAGGVASGVIGGSSAIELYNEYIGRDITQDDGVTVLATSSSGTKWSTETIIASQPDLIICSTSMSGYSTISAPAEAAEIDCIAVDYADLGDYLKWFKVFSLLTNNTDLYETVALNTLSEVAEVIYECNNSNLESPRVFSMFSGTKSFTANTRNVLVGSMIETLGATNIVTEWGETSEERLTIDFEKVYASKPEIILIQCHSDTETSSALLESLYGDNELWQAVKSEVGENNIFWLEKVLYHNKPNSRFAEAYQNLAKILYPNYTFSFEA